MSLHHFAEGTKDNLTKLRYEISFVFTLEHLITVHFYQLFTVNER